MHFEFNFNNIVAFLDRSSDTRTQDWPFVRSPCIALFCVFSYLVFVVFGPNRMKLRKAMDFKAVIVVYNSLLVIGNAYMFVLFVQHGLLNSKFNLICDTVDYSNDRSSVMLAWAIYIYFLSKLVELLDTIFFILRKKNNQVTFLHVYHHATMPILWWLGSKYVAGGESYLSPLLNTFVHVIMYGYYALSALGPWIQPYLWWKKYITMLQMTQFVIVISKTMFTLVIGCSFPNVYLWGQFAYMLSLLILFLDFYRQTYKSHSRVRTTKETNGSINDKHSVGDVVQKMD